MASKSKPDPCRPRPLPLSQAKSDTQRRIARRIPVQCSSRAACGSGGGGDRKEKRRAGRAAAAARRRPPPPRRRTLSRRRGLLRKREWGGRRQCWATLCPRQPPQLQCHWWWLVEGQKNHPPHLDLVFLSHPFSVLPCRNKVMLRLGWSAVVL